MVVLSRGTRPRLPIGRVVRVVWVVLPPPPIVIPHGEIPVLRHMRIVIAHIGRHVVPFLD